MSLVQLQVQVLTLPRSRPPLCWAMWGVGVGTAVRPHQEMNKWRIHVTNHQTSAYLTLLSSCGESVRHQKIIELQQYLNSIYSELA